MPAAYPHRLIVQNRRRPHVAALAFQVDALGLGLALQLSLHFRPAEIEHRRQLWLQRLGGVSDSFLAYLHLGQAARSLAPPRLDLRLDLLADLRLEVQQHLDERIPTFVQARIDGPEMHEGLRLSQFAPKSCRVQGYVPMHTDTYLFLLFRLLLDWHRRNFLQAHRQPEPTPNEILRLQIWRDEELQLLQAVC